MKTIIYGYDKYQKIWWINVEDENGNTQDYEYGNKNTIDYLIKEYKNQYNTNLVNRR